MGCGIRRGEKIIRGWLGRLMDWGMCGGMENGEKLGEGVWVGVGNIGGGNL